MLVTNPSYSPIARGAELSKRPLLTGGPPLCYVVLTDLAKCMSLSHAFRTALSRRFLHKELFPAFATAGP